MYPLRLFSNLASPKKLAYESSNAMQEPPVGDEDGALVLSAPQLAVFVTTRRDPGLDLSPPNSIAGEGGDFDLSPPKTIQRGRKRNPPTSSDVAADGTHEAARNDQSAAQTPGRAAKRKTKLSWQSRRAPDTTLNAQHRRSPSLTRIQSDNCRLDVAPDPATSRSLQQSASFSGLSAKEGWNNNKTGQESRDNVPCTPRGSRKGGGRPPMNSELTSSVTSLCSVTSVATPRSAARRHGGASYSRSTGAVGNSARMLLQAPQVSQFATEEPYIQLEEDPTFWQDHNVQVLIRTRPISSSEIAQQGYSRCVKQENAHTIAWLGQPESRFTFDHVAGECISQEELFRVAGLPMVENCMAGYNSCMFAYGQTGSGKTHTMLGDIADLDHQPSDDRGMTPRVFESLFAKIQVEEELQKHENLKFKCRCSFLEIYNEQIADLLEPSSSNLQMREDTTKGVYVEGLLEVEVLNVQDVLHLLLLGAANRRVAATSMNRESSRSHSVFTCIIESQWECDSMINFRFGRLNLVDLAGSERQKASGAEGERLKEAASINKSLSTLGLVIMVLVDVANGKQRHVPYRDSKLTFLLQDSLGGNSKTMIVANISPSSCASSETLSTLKFAQRAKFIQNNATVNEDAAGDMNALRQQIQQLKDELARLRRQSISRIPTVRASGTRMEGVINEDSPSKNELDLPNCSTGGSFLQFGRVVLSPTALNKKIKALEAVLAGALRREQAAEIFSKRSAVEIEHLKRLVRQREDETHCNKMILRFREDKIHRLESLCEDVVSSKTYHADERDAVLKELQLMREQKGCNPELTRFAMENIRLQEQLCRFKDFDTGGEREAMTQEISSLREQLLDVLDSKLSLDTLANIQRDASVAELAAERRQLELLHIEVDSYQKDLQECRTNLSNCLESNEKMSSQLDALRTELDSANEMNSKLKQDFETLQEKALEIDYLELKQAQHQQLMFEVKTLLRKSEERAQEEANRRIQLEQQLKEAQQESANLQTELQWTKDSLDAAESLVETLQENDVSSETGVDRCRESGLSQAHIIEQLQLELVEMKTTLEDERTRGRGLEEQIADHGKQESKHKRVESSESYDSAGNTRVRHHDAILQLQMELDSIDGAPVSAIRSYRWEEGTRDEDANDEAEVKHSVTIMQLQLDLEAAESVLEEERKRLKEVEASSARLQKQLNEMESKLFAEKAIVDALKDCQNLTVNELESLNVEYKMVLERLSKKDEEGSVLKQRISKLEWELAKTHEIRVIEKEAKEITETGYVDRARKFALDAKLEKAILALDRAQDLNLRNQGVRVLGDGTQSDDFNSGVCMTSIQTEILELRDEVAGAMEREAAARQEVASLAQDLANVNVELKDVQEEYERLLTEKENEICALQQGWEGAAARLIDYLAAGEFSVDAASSQATQDLFSTSLSRAKNLATDKIIQEVLEKQKAVESLQKQLHDACKLATSSERNLQDLSESMLEETYLYSIESLDEKERGPMLLGHENAKLLRMELGSCDVHLRDLERKCKAATIMVWWLSETAGLRYVAEDKVRVELTEAVAKIQEREGVLFSLKLERERTPEKESRSIQLKALRVHKELAAWEEERIQLAAKKEKFEIQVRELASLLENLHTELGTAERRLQQVDKKTSEVATAQASLAVAKENWKAEKSALVSAAAEAELRYMHVKEELCATQDDLQRLHAQSQEAESREDAVQAERFKLEEELKKHLEAVHVLAEALQNQIEMKEQEILKLKEQNAEQYEDWVLERSDLVVANRELEACCMEKNQIIANLQCTIASFQGHMSAAGCEVRTLDGKMYKLKELPSDEARLQLEERVEEMTNSLECLNAQILELQQERDLLGNDMEHARVCIAQKEEEFAAVQKKYFVAEESRKQAVAKLEALTVLMDQFACSEGNWLSERESLRTEIRRLQSCIATMERDLQSQQVCRTECTNSLTDIQKDLEVVERTVDEIATKDSENVEVELAKVLAVLAGSEEKVKLLTEMVVKMGETWAMEREQLLSEKEDLQVELSKFEQHTDMRRSLDQPLRNLSENRSVPTADNGTNTKHMEKLRQECQRMRTEIGNLRTKVREKDNVILNMQMELSAALANCKALEVEMEKMAIEKKQMLPAEMELQRKLRLFQTAESEVSMYQGSDSDIQRLTLLVLETEERMKKAEQKWMEEKVQLETAREEAELEANEKKNEAAAMLVKFEEWKTTLREADSLVNALVQVNEKAKQRWKREKERLSTVQAAETNKVVQEMLEAVDLTKNQVDTTMGDIEVEMKALVAETQMLKMEMKAEILKLKREKPGSIDELSRSMEMLPSVKCLDSERRSWEQQFKAATTVLTEKEATIRSLQAEVDKTRKQTVVVQNAHSDTLQVLKEKEDMIMKLVNELNHLNQNVIRDRSLRQSLTRDIDGYTSLRRSFSCKLIEEKESTLNVLKEEQENLKTMVFSLETENAELQQQLLEVEAKATSMESTIGILEGKIKESTDQRGDLTEQLEESTRHISELELHRMELRDEMQRQAVSFAELYEQLQRQEGALEGEARTIASKVAEEKEVLQTLEEEKAQLKCMVERLDTELTVYEKKAASAETSQAELERLKSEMEGLQKELERTEFLQKKIDTQNSMLDSMSEQRLKLEENLVLKNKELTRIGEELMATRASAEFAAQECAELRGQVDHLQEKVSVLEEELTRKRSAIKAMEVELLTVEETMARCLEDATLDLKELEMERDKLHSELLVLHGQLESTQVVAQERAETAAEAQKIAELSKTRAEEKQVEADILGRSVEELESTVYALESQLGLLKQESERQRLMREDLEMELQGLQNRMSIMQAAHDEASARSAKNLLEAQSAREDAERRLEENEAEMQLAYTNLEKLQSDSEDKAEKIRQSKAQISDLLAEAEKKAAEYDQKIKVVEIKLEERVNSPFSFSKGSKLKGTGSTFTCMGMGHQVDSELIEERQSYERRIEELEAALGEQQKEVSMLSGKLAGAERMTRDVLQDLLGVKSDMTNVANLLEQQQSQRGALEKDEEVEHLLSQLNEFIEERESWLEEISQRQAALLAAQGVQDRLREREKKLITETEKFKGESRIQQKRIGELEQEVKKLSGQQNLQQRIKHHAKIKDENNSLRIQNDDLSGKIRRAELLYSRVCDELAKYRTAEGKTPLLNVDEEQRLQTMLQEAETQNFEVAEKLSNLLSGVLKATGISCIDDSTEPAIALDAVHQLKNHLESTKLELEDTRLKMRILGEKQRLNELRNVHSPMKGIGNFTAQCLAPR